MKRWLQVKLSKFDSTPLKKEKHSNQTTTACNSAIRTSLFQEQLPVPEGWGEDSSSPNPRSDSHLLCFYSAWLGSSWPFQTAQAVLQQQDFTPRTLLYYTGTHHRHLQLQAHVKLVLNSLHPCPRLLHVLPLDCTDFWTCSGWSKH